MDLSVRHRRVRAGVVALSKDADVGGEPRAGTSASDVDADVLSTVPEVEALPQMPLDDAFGEEFPALGDGSSSSAATDLEQASDSTPLKASNARWRQTARPKGFQAGVLVASDGTVLGGGDGPELEGSPELLEWLEARGCVGAKRLIMKAAGGIYLRKDSEAVQVDAAVLRIPKSAWLEGAKSESEAPEALAWQLLKELWAGPASEFAPFVSLLRRGDVSNHPLMWEDEEVMWLGASPETLERVVKLRRETDGRVSQLLARAQKDASAQVPEHLASDEDALARELRWALCIVEAQGIALGDEDTGTITSILCPLVGDVKNDSSATPGPSVQFSPDKESIEIMTLRRLRPGEQLRQRCIPNGSASELLATLGIVPGAELVGVPKDTELLDMNSDNGVLLEVPEMDMSNFPPSYNLVKKLSLLEAHTGLQLGAPRLIGTPVAKFCLRLPEDCYGIGRLLPIALFLSAQVTNSGTFSDPDEQIALMFNFFFERCRLESYPSAPTIGKNAKQEFSAELEVGARRLAVQWCKEQLNKCSVMIDMIARDTGLPASTKGGLISVGEGHIVLSYFKARRKDGTIGKSRSPRQARVISVLDEGLAIRLEFLQTKKRHEVPADWVVEAQPTNVAGLVAAGCTAARVQRGRLAITLLRTERASIWLYYDALSTTADYIERMNKAATRFQEQEDTENYNKCCEEVQRFLAEEVRELDEDMMVLLPQTLSRLQKFRMADGSKSRYSDLPVWGLPPVNYADMLDDADASAGLLPEATSLKAGGKGS